MAEKVARRRLKRRLTTEQTQDARAALLQARDVIGSYRQLADRLHVRVQAIIGWVNRGMVPAERAVEIERVTGGQVRAEQMRPDVFADRAPMPGTGEAAA